MRVLLAIVAVSFLALLAQSQISRLQERLITPVVTRALAANSTATITAGAATYRVTVNSVDAGQTAPGLPPAAQGRTSVVVILSLETTGPVGDASGARTLPMSDDLNRFPLVIPGRDATANHPLAPWQPLTRTLVFDAPSTNGLRVKWLYYRDSLGPQAVESTTGK